MRPRPSRASATDTDRGAILLIGDYLEEEIVAERGLPATNPAGSHRLLQLAQAAAAGGLKPIIVSSGAAMRIGWRGRILHPSRARKRGSVTVVFAACVGIRFLSAFLKGILVACCLVTLRRRYPGLLIAIVYNTSLSNAFVGAFWKCVLRGRVVLDLEDVGIVRVRDFLPGAEARGLSELLDVAGRHVLCRLAVAALTPTRQFVQFLPRGMPVAVISGCVPTPNGTERREEHCPEVTRETVRVLWAGKIMTGHGLRPFLDALRQLAAVGIGAPRMQIDVCGSTPNASRLQDALRDTGFEGVAYRGFVTDREYDGLLRNADVCLALQEPGGRFGPFRTPSKAYEFLAAGKAVVATDVGDLDELPAEVLRILRPFNGWELAQALADFARAPKEAADMGCAARGFAAANFAPGIVGPRMAHFIDMYAR
jgi:glycosyltransferase involved in cell wall biosynthesis